VVPLVYHGGVDEEKMLTVVKLPMPKYFYVLKSPFRTLLVTDSKMMQMRKCYFTLVIWWLNVLFPIRIESI